jgi:hypothetical protein
VRVCAVEKNWLIWFSQGPGGLEFLLLWRTALERCLK